MAKLNINIGDSANDKSGDTLRVAFGKANSNFAELYTLTGGTSAALTELAQDYAAPLFNHASHTNITATYDDANNKILLTGAAAQVQSDWNASSGLGVILNKPTLFSGSYTDLTSKPTIPAAAVWPVTNTTGASGPTKVAIGQNAGNVTQGYSAVAIGANAGETSQGNSAVAIGEYTGQTTQGDYAVAVGRGAGYTAQGANAVAIGRLSGYSNQGNNSIIINATGSALNQTTPNTFTVAPIRNASGTSGVLQYNSSTKEVSYSNEITVNSNTWTFGTDGTLTFPNATVQSTAYVAPTTGNSVIDSINPLTISRNGMTIRVTSAGMIQMSFNSVISITGRSSINNADSVVISSPNGATTSSTWYNIGAVLAAGDHLTATIADSSFHRIYRLTAIIREKGTTPGSEFATAYAIIEQLQ